jgi:SH3 domain-containing kinase-binding protein 1
MSLSRAKRPISSAAGFFRKNGQSTNTTTTTTSSKHRDSSPPIPRSSTRARLEVNETERALLIDLLPGILQYLTTTSLLEDGLFVKDPSAGSQEAMMGLQVGPTKAMIAVRALVDVYGDEKKTNQTFKEHSPHAWAGAVKVIVKEMSYPLLGAAIVSRLGEIKNETSETGQVALIKRILAEIPRKEYDILASLCRVLLECPTEKDKLGHMFSAIMLLPQIDTASGSLGGGGGGSATIAQVEALSASMKLMIQHADEIFGTTKSVGGNHKTLTTKSSDFTSQEYEDDEVDSPKQSYQQPSVITSSGKKPPPPPPPPAPPTRSTHSNVKTPPILCQARCTYDFDPENDDELELRVGDVIDVFVMGQDGWWKGRLTLPDGTTEEGVFPNTYVEKVDPSEEDSLYPVMHQQIQSTMSNSNMPSSSPIKPITNKQPSGSTLLGNEPLSSPTSSSSSYNNNNNYQPFTNSAPPPPTVVPFSHKQPSPSNAASTLKSGDDSTAWGSSAMDWTTSSSSSATAAPPPSSSSSSPTTEMYALALFNFDPVEDVELKLVEGERFIVTNREDPDWWRGRTSDGRQGLFPYSYCKLLEPVHGGYSNGGSGPPPAPQRVSSIRTLDTGIIPGLTSNKQPSFSSPSTSFQQQQPQKPPPPPPTSTNNYNNNNMMMMNNESLYSGLNSLPPGSANTALKFATSLPPDKVAAGLQATHGIPPSHTMTALKVASSLPPGTASAAMGMAASNPDATKAILQKSGSSRSNRPPAPPPPPPSSINTGLQAMTVSGSGMNLAKPINRAPAPPPPPSTATGTSTSSSMKPPAPLPPTQSVSNNNNNNNNPPPPAWLVTADLYQKYVSFFETLPKDERGLANGRDVANFLVQSGLPKPTIARILELCDLDGDKMFDRDEFAVAMHVSVCVSKRGMPLFDQLPSYLIPKSKKAIVSSTEPYR